jgi:hypothetical protein
MLSGFRFYALSYSETTAPLEPRFVLLAGTQWAKISQRLILETIDRVTIESLMVRPATQAPIYCN